MVLTIETNYSAQEEGAQFDFSRRHPFVELWRSLDVQCQRLSALMIVLKAQAEDPKCDVAGMWASLELFEFRAPIFPLLTATIHYIHFFCSSVLFFASFL